MANRKINVKIVGPDSVFFQSPMDILTLKTIEGFLGIMRDHVPFISLVRPCVIELDQNKQKRKAVIGEGIIYNDGDEIKIITNDALWLDGFSIEKEQKRLNKLEGEMKKSKEGSDEYAQIDFEMKKIINRIHLVEK